MQQERSLIYSERGNMIGSLIPEPACSLPTGISREYFALLHSQHTADSWHLEATDDDRKWRACGQVAVKTSVWR